MFLNVIKAAFGFLIIYVSATRFFRETSSGAQYIGALVSTLFFVSIGIYLICWAFVKKNK